jgi:DNA polymerase elongation subunit (family B)
MVCLVAKILILDIETAPNIAYVWRYFKENIGAKQVIENGYMLSYAAKWLMEEEVYYEDLSNQHEADMLSTLHPLLDVADIVIAHNGDKFDLPHIQGRFLMHGLKPPAPYKQIDTVKVARQEFNFPSNSLEYLSNVLDLPIKKGGHKKFPGFELWLGVLRNDPEAWAEMKEYNIDDIKTLEHLYLKFLPYMRNHPNVAVYGDATDPCCPKCGSDKIHYRGYAHTNVGRYHRFQCNSCGGWGRTRYDVRTMEERKLIMANAVN